MTYNVDHLKDCRFVGGSFGLLDKSDDGKDLYEGRKSPSSIWSCGDMIR